MSGEFSLFTKICNVNDHLEMLRLHQGTLVTTLVSFEKSYVVTYLCKVSFSRPSWFRIYEGESCQLPGYTMSKTCSI